MKEQLIGNNKYGFVTLEILIAFTVVILCISASIMVFWGNQLIMVDSQNNITAISKAKIMIEQSRVDSIFDFNLVSPSITIDIDGLAFIKKLDVDQVDLFTKKVTATVSWQTMERNLSTKLVTLLINKDILDSDTCSSILKDDWGNLQVESSINFSSIFPSGTYPLTDIDVYENKLYVTAGKTDNVTDPTIFVFDINDLNNPRLIGQIDNDIQVKTGLNAITINGYNGFVASASSYIRGQMQIVDFSTMSIVKTFKVPVLNPSGSSKGSGNSIFYKNKIVYLGLTKSTSENEFNIIDVSDFLNPVQIGKYSISNAVNTMIIRDGYAYIASPNTEELQILNISNLSDPILAGGFNSVNGAGNGKVIYLVGNKLYLGKTTGIGFDFHILDNTNSNITLPQLGGFDIGTNNSVNEVIVRDYLSFLLTNKDLQIFNTSDPLNIINKSIFILPGTYNSSYPEPSMDCEGNRIFITSNNEGGQGVIYIIKPKSP